MEDVLKVHDRDFDDNTVLECLDKTSKQQAKETRTPLPTRPGQPAGFGFEYERRGTANLFMVHALLLAWRHVEVTDRRTRQDFAGVLVDIADVHFPQQEERSRGQPQHPQAVDALRGGRAGGDRHVAIRLMVFPLLRRRAPRPSGHGRPTGKGTALSGREKVDVTASSRPSDLRRSAHGIRAQSRRPRLSTCTCCEAASFNVYLVHKTGNTLCHRHALGQQRVTRCSMSQ